MIAGVLEYDGLGARKLKEKDIFVHPLDVTKTESVVDFTSYVQALPCRAAIDRFAKRIRRSRGLARLIDRIEMMDSVCSATVLGQ